MLRILDHTRVRKTLLRRYHLSSLHRSGLRRYRWRAIGRSGCTLLLLLSILLALVPPRTVLSVPLPEYHTANALARMITPAGAELEFMDAKIVVPKGALQVATTIWIERVEDAALPPLDPGMVNVTTGDGGYRFLPRGLTFDKPVSIVLPLKEPFAGDGTQGVGGVYTYFWDESQGRWVRLQKLHVETCTKRLVSTTTHFTTMINAILTAPDHPSPLLFNPNSIKDFAAVEPTAGIDLIEPPTANNQGTAELTYPIRLPQGRGAYSPQLALTYSSSGGNGWLGTGWDLTVPRIEVDTRWGVPAYDGSERFLLNGAALVPVSKDPNVACKASTAATVDQQFAPRNDTFDRIIRCSAVDNIHWEVTIKDGTRFEYGIDSESRLTSYYEGEESHTAIWFLRRVVDTNGNTTEYHYVEDNGQVASFKGEPFVQKYLASVEYTSHPETKLAATYRVHLADPKTDCGARNDLVISGRTGFKVLTRCRLSKIDVLFQGPDSPSGGKLVRRYRLEYVAGEFGKSVLSKIRTQGADGSDFYQHSFEYTQPEYKTRGEEANPFADTIAWGAKSSDLFPLAQRNRLLSRTSETSHHLGGGVGVSLEFGPEGSGIGCSAGLAGDIYWEYPKPWIQHVDINGDGTLDRVWRADGQIRALIGSPEDRQYTGSILNTAAFTASGLPHLGTEDVLGGGIGLDAGCYAGGAQVGVGASFSSRIADANSLLVDADGDGRLDLALGDSFYRGLPHLCRDGSPPNARGKCTDGLSGCPDTNVLCFGNERISSLSPMSLATNATAMEETVVAQVTDPIGLDHVEAGRRQPRAASCTNLSLMADSSRLSIPAQEHALPLTTSEVSSSQVTETIQSGEVETVWGPYTSLRRRMEQEPALAAEMVRLDPVIRWDAQHDGTIALTAQARRRYTGGTDGVTVSLLQVVDPTDYWGTQLLGQIQLPPDLTAWTTLPITIPSLDVRFRDSILLVVDTLNDVPVDSSGAFLDEIDLNLHIEYQQVCPLGQDCHVLTQEDMEHRDATGQLAYVFDFPTDFRLSELPRTEYWQLLPPLGPPRPRESGKSDPNRITGTVTKVTKTDTPVHVRIRCESMLSRQAGDDTVCPLGTVLWEKVFTADELGQVSAEVPLPSPWIEDDDQVLVQEAPVALISKQTEIGIKVQSYADLNQTGVRIYLQPELADLASQLFPKADLNLMDPVRGCVGYPDGSGFCMQNEEIYLYELLQGTADALISSYGTLQKAIASFPSDLTQGLPHVNDGTFFCCPPDQPQPLVEMGKRYDPLRLLFEVDGENGWEVPPEAVSWDPRIEIVSLHELQELNEPDASIPVALVSKRSEALANAQSYEDLNRAGILVAVPCNASDTVVSYLHQYLPNAAPTCSLPGDPWAIEFRGEYGQLAYEIVNVVRGKSDVLVAEYGELQEALDTFPTQFRSVSLQDPTEHTFLCCPKSQPRPMHAAVRALVRDNSSSVQNIYTYDDLNQAQIDLAVRQGSEAELVVDLLFPDARKATFPTDQQVLDTVLQGDADALIAAEEFLKSAVADPVVSTQAFLCCPRGGAQQIGTKPSLLTQGPAIFLDPAEPWIQGAPVLYRVHPARQLRPFRTLVPNQEVRITATVVNPHHPLFVTVIGDPVEGEVGRMIVQPDEAKAPSVQPLSDMLVALVSRWSSIQSYDDLNQPDKRILVLGKPMEELVRKYFPRAKIVPHYLPGDIHMVSFLTSVLGLGGSADVYIGSYDYLSSLLSASQELFPLPPLEPLPWSSSLHVNSLSDVASLCCPRDQPYALTGSVMVSKSFTLKLPKPGLYYVRGYTEASFDPRTSVTITAELLDAVGLEQLALVSKTRAPQIQVYGDLNDPRITIGVEDESPAEHVARKLFPNASLLEAPREEALTLVVADVDAHAMIADADFVLRALADPHNSAQAFACCPRSIPEPLLPDIPVPTNLLMADFGRGEHLSPTGLKGKLALEANVVGEVPYSFDPYAGGHHGFFYGLHNGEKPLTCIGPYPCRNEPVVTALCTTTSEPDIESTDLPIGTIDPVKERQGDALAHDTIPVAETTTVLDSTGTISRWPSTSQLRAASQAHDPPSGVCSLDDETGQLALVRNRLRGEAPVEEYVDLNNPSVEIWVPADTDAETVARESLPEAQIRLFRFADIVEVALNVGEAGHGDALIADAAVLYAILAAHPGLAGKAYLCCPRELPHPLQSCEVDWDNDGIPNCSDYCPDVPEDLDGDQDDDGCPEDPPILCKDSDGDGFSDCTDPCPEDQEDFVGAADGCPDKCVKDSDGDSVPDCEDPQPFLREDHEDVASSAEIKSKFAPLGVGRSRNKDCFVGADPAAYICDGSTHPTRKNYLPPQDDYGDNGEDSDGDDGDDQDNEGLRRSSSFGLSAYAGVSVAPSKAAPAVFGANASFGIGSTYKVLEFGDWNGDGLPDRLSPNSITLSGRNEKPITLTLPCYIYSQDDPDVCQQYPGVSEGINATLGVAANVGAASGGSYVHLTTPSGETKGQSWKADQGVGLFSQAGQSSTVLDRFDINGDGLPDLIIGRHSGGKSRISVRLNLGYRLGEEEEWGDTELASHQGLGILEEMLSDLVEERALYQSANLTKGFSSGGGGGFKIGIFGGSGRATVTDNVSISQSSRVVADLNGDGLPDLVLKNPQNPAIMVRFNRGGTLSPKESVFQAPQVFANAPPWIFDTKIPDSPLNPFEGVASWVNQAIKDSTDGLDLSGMETTAYEGEAEAVIFFVSVSHSYKYVEGYSFAESSLYDVNGDDLPDRVLRSGKESGADVQVQENQFGGANLLQVIHRPLGGRIVLNYTRNIPTDDDPNTRWLLTSYVLDHEDTFSSTHKTTALTEAFEYQDSYYDRYEREFLGFRLVRSTRGDGRVEETIYQNRDYRLRGLVQRTRVLDQGGKIYVESENQFEPVRTHVASDLSARQVCLKQLILPLRWLANSTLDKVGNTPCDAWFAKPTETVTRWFEGETVAQETSQRYEAYDQYGNVVRLHDTLDAGPADDLVVTITYAYQTAAGVLPDAHQKALLSAYIVDRVESIDVRQATLTGQQLRYRRGDYDDKGNLVAHQIYADSAGEKVATLNVAYDPTGFMIAITDTAGYHIEYTPDDVINLFAKQIKDSFGLTSTATYDFRFQMPVEQIDANGQKQVSQYDAYGRLSAIQGPYELAAGLASLAVNYTMSSLPARATTTNLAVVPGNSTVATVIRTAIFCDGLGRPIQTQVDAEVNGNVGRIVSGKVTFDSGGRVIQQGQPVFKVGTQIQIETLSLVPGRFTEWEYDALDRAIKTTAPGNRVTHAAFDLSTHPLSSLRTRRTEIIDPNGEIRFEHRDATDRLVAIVQVLNGRDLVTSYTYLPTGELLSIVDARDQETTLEYDLAGRRTAVTTPDTGRLELGYDANGNLAEKTDQVLCPSNTDLLESCSDSEKVHYAYDKNRLVGITYPLSSKVEFLYGDVSAPGECTGMNTKGRICQVVDDAGTEQRSYGALGEVIKSTRVMLGAPWESTDRTFATQFVYDSFGRMLSLVYPDGETLTYTYDKGGQVRSVSGSKGNDSTVYVKDIRYDEFGQRTRLEYGNGVVTTYDYAPDTRRLITETIRPVTLAVPLRTVHYDYDPVGNILSIRDMRATASPFLKQVNRIFAYDDLHRVKTMMMTAHESAAASNSPMMVAASYDYDVVGNIIDQSITRHQDTQSIPDYPSRSWVYTYGNSQHPNLPDKIGPYSFTYDERGSILTSVRESTSDAPLGATYTWDEEGRLLTSTRQDSALVTRYTYDADGQRVRKQTPTMLGDPAKDAADATVYPNEFYAARFARTAQDTCASPPCWEQVVSRSKQIYVDGQRLAVVAQVVDPSGAGGDESKLGFLASVSHYLHSDSVGSTTLQTDQDGKRAQEIDYLPFGEVLVDNSAPEDTGLPQTYRFDAKELDHETDLQYFGARYYDPRIGRWLSADPLYRIAPEAGLDMPSDVSLYVFTVNNPVRYRDLEGLRRPPPRWQSRYSRPRDVRREQARIKNAVRSAVEAESLRHQKREAHQYEIRSSRFELTILRYLAEAGFTGTSGPPASVGQAVGALPCEIIATIETGKGIDEIYRGLARLAAVKTALAEIAKARPQGRVPLYGVLVPDERVFAVAAIGTDRGAMQKMAAEMHWQFVDLTKRFEQDVRDLQYMNRVQRSRASRRDW